MSSKARAIRTPATLGAPATGKRPDYLDAFKVARSSTDARSAEQWSRAVFEGAPAPVRWFLLAGWRAVLGLRLGPLRSLDHVLGWRITSSEPETVCLELRSALMTSELALRLDGSTAVWTTRVTYKRRLGRPLWASVGLIHRRVVPYLLGRAASLPQATTPA